MLALAAEVPRKKCKLESMSQKFMLSLESQEEKKNTTKKEALSVETTTESSYLLSKSSKLPQTNNVHFPKNCCFKFDFKMERENSIKCIWSLFKSSDCSLISYYNSIFYLDLYFSKVILAVKIEDIHLLAILSLTTALTETKVKTDTLKKHFLELSLDFNLRNLKSAEVEILSVINFNRQIKTSFELSLELMNKNPLTQHDFPNEQLLRIPLATLQNSFKKLVFFMVDLTTKYFSFNKFDVELITVSCLLCSQTCLSISSFSKWLMEIANNNLEPIIECICLIRLVLEEIEPSILEMFHVQIQGLVDELQDRKEIEEVLIKNDQDYESPWPKSEPVLINSQVKLGKRETGDWSANQTIFTNETGKHHYNVLSFSNKNKSELQKKASVFLEIKKKGY